MIRIFEEGSSKVYVFDEGEQGQPAYKFELTDQGEVALSIIDSQYPYSGSADPEWQNITFSFLDFKINFKKPTEAFLQFVTHNAPEQLDEWIKLFFETN